MIQTENTRGISLLCDRGGKILQVILDELGINELSAGQSLTLMVDRGSLEKALSFLVELKENGAVFDWEMNVPIGEQIASLHFGGSLIEDHLLVVASSTKNGAQKLHEDIMRINNEQSNLLRALLKKESQTTQPQDHREEKLYNDISRLNNELVSTQRELAKKNAELKRLDELKNQFLGMAAHDLRHPLGAIMNFSEFLIDEASHKLKEEHLEFLEIIRSSSKFMLRLVNDLLDVAKIETGNLHLDLRPTNLIQLIKHNIDLNRILAEKKQIEITFFQQDQIPEVMVDPAKMEMVLNNLISNAVKYSNPGKIIKVFVLLDTDHVIIRVQDQGQGIPNEELDKLFKPFSKTSVRSTANEQSTGLGLAIAHSIVEGHHGKIWVESEVGQGSTFNVSLPISFKGD